MGFDAANHTNTTGQQSQKHVAMSAQFVISRCTVDLASDFFGYYGRDGKTNADIEDISPQLGLSIKGEIGYYKYYLP